MKEYNLTAKEIIYLCALKGAKFVAGVEDVFMSVPRENLVGIMSETKDSLVKKECLVMDFDGNYAPAEDINILIDIIIHSDKRVAFFAVDGGREKHGMIYIKSDTAYLSERSEELYHIKPVEIKEILPFFDLYFQNDESENNPQISISVDVDVLKNVKELATGKKNTSAGKVLTDAGVDEKTAALFMASYAGEATYLGVKTDSLMPDNIFSDGLIYISDGSQSVDVAFNPESGNDVLNIKSISPDEEKETLKAMLAKVLSANTETGEKQ